MSKVIIDKKTIRDITKVLQTGKLTQGEKTKIYENILAEFSGSKYAVAVNSGTAALHSALMSAGISNGDEVITTPFTFVATANAIIMCGAKPVFADIDSRTFNIDSQKIVAKITKKTKAILSVDLYGNPCNYENIRKTADKYKLIFISDACQSIAAKYRNKHLIKYADIVCYSFYATKNTMMGEGGAIVTNIRKYADFVRRFRHHGQDELTRYNYKHLGYNYRTTDILAVLGINQISHLVKFTKKRLINADFLTAGLSGIQGLVTPYSDNNSAHVYHQYTVRITKDFPLSRNRLKDYLYKKGISTSIFYPAILPAFNHIKNSSGYKVGEFPVAEQAASEVLSLPVHPYLKKEDLKEIVKAIKSL